MAIVGGITLQAFHSRGSVLMEYSNENGGLLFQFKFHKLIIDYKIITLNL